VARLLGYANYAERALATRMAETTDQVLGFLQDLADRSLPAAREDLEAVRAFAADEFGVNELEAWDVPYYSEKLRQARYAISQEELKPYFPVTRVLSTARPVLPRPLRPPQQARRRLDGRVHLGPSCAIAGRCRLPVAYLTCNFTPPVGDQPALLTHDEVTTLFHEFGHGLHHMLTRIDYLPVAGISGVPWDAVELPSQFMENWCWEREALDLIAGHFETGETLPDRYALQRMMAARNFQSAMQMVRQLEFSIFDLRMHREYDPARGGRVHEILDEVRRRWRSCSRRPSTASRTASRISSRAATRPATTATSGPRC
jgi:oligopeptidase A